MGAERGSRLAKTASLTLSALSDSFRLALESENKSPRTLETYGQALAIFAAYLAEQGHSGQVKEITRDHVAAFTASLLVKGNKPATASNRFRALKTFFKWAEGEGEIRQSPMANMKGPNIPEETTPIIPDAHIVALLKVCEGNDFYERRDTAIIRLLLDAGLRRAELCGITVEDVDMPARCVHVIGKGSRPRAVPFGARTARALDRYNRTRALHAMASLPDFWLGRQGPLTHWGLELMISRRCKQAGIPDIHPHQFRHTFAHHVKKDGMAEADIMAIAGWRSRQMLDRYAKAAESERARAAHKDYSPGDKF
jgi:site-specific recombinase XerD